MTSFFAIDVETANASFASICQIGLVEFRDGQEVAAYSWLVDPQDYFDEYNIAIHGITAKKVAGSPTFAKVGVDIAGLLGSATLVCHTHFDRVAMRQACERHKVSHPSCQWLDSARVVRRTWDDFAVSGYGLANVASSLGISFKHHDALEDARTAGLILLAAITHSGTQLDEWHARVRASISGTTTRISREGDGDGPLLGERLVFTGALTMTRSSAADMAHEMGGAVDPGVTKATTILVVGDQDISRLKSHSKSGKHLKAEQLISKGQRIRVLGETDFLAFHKMEQ